MAIFPLPPRRATDLEAMHPAAEIVQSQKSSFSSHGTDRPRTPQHKEYAASVSFPAAPGTPCRGTVAVKPFIYCTVQSIIANGWRSRSNYFENALSLESSSAGSLFAATESARIQSDREFALQRKEAPGQGGCRCSRRRRARPHAKSLAHAQKLCGVRLLEKR